MGPYGSSGNIVYLSWRRFVRSRSGRQFLFLRIRKRIGGEIPVAKGLVRAPVSDHPRSRDSPGLDLPSPKVDFVEIPLGSDLSVLANINILLCQLHRRTRLSLRLQRRRWG